MFGFNKQRRLDAKLVSATAEGNIRDMAALLDAGADIETRDGSRYHGTPLCTAALNGYLPAVRLLLDRGAVIDAQDKLGESPLMNAVLNKYPDVVAELVKRGANAKLQNNKGLTPVDVVKDDKVRVALGIPAEKPPVAPVDPGIAPDPDEIILKRRVGDKILEEAFNFASRERISMVRTPGGPVEAMTRESFDAIGERCLRQAFEAYTRQGGAIPESEVFPGALAKVKPQQRPGAA